MGFFSKLLRIRPAGSKKTPFTTSISCPSCSTVLSKIPTSKAKCKNCGKFIYVRTDYKTNDKLYLSEEQKDNFDSDRKDFYFQKEWKRQLSGLGISEQDMVVAQEELTKKWGNSPSFNDLVWRLFNSRVIKLAKNGADLHDFKMLYFTWALFACAINSNPNELQKQAHKYELLAHKRTGFVDKVDISSDVGCNECVKLNGKIFDIDDLLKENDILPNKNCTNKLDSDNKYSWCRCMFLALTPLSSSTKRWNSEKKKYE